MMTQNTTIFRASILILKQSGGDHVYTDEPLADEEWLKEYEQQDEKKKVPEGLTDRLSGKQNNHYRTCRNFDTLTHSLQGLCKYRLTHDRS